MLVTTGGREGEQQAPARITEDSFSSRTKILRLRLRMTRPRGFSNKVNKNGACCYGGRHFVLSVFYMVEARKAMRMRRRSICLLFLPLTLRSVMWTPQFHLV